MIGRLLLVLVLVLGVGLYLPESRAMLGEWVRPLTVPAYRWMTAQELKQIAIDFEIYLGGRGFEPIGRGEFDVWLDDRYPQARSRVDSWDTRYTVEVTRSGFTVRSAGPDRTPDTPDDILAEGTRD